MFGMMSGKRVAVTSDRMYPLFSIRDSGVRKVTTDIGALAAKEANCATALVWNYHDDDTTGAPASVQLQCSGLPAQEISIKQYRIDAAHSNSYEVWKKMGSPQQPTAAQITQLEKEGQLKQVGASKAKTKNGLLQLNMQLPRQGIVFIKITW
jgi:xylan 1,4-beta-xylosidase